MQCVLKHVAARLYVPKENSLTTRTYCIVLKILIINTRTRKTNMMVIMTIFCNMLMLQFKRYKTNYVLITLEPTSSQN